MSVQAAFFIPTRQKRFCVQSLLRKELYSAGTLIALPMLRKECDNMKLFKKSVCAVLLFSFVFSYAASYSAVGLTDDGVLQSAPVLPPEDEIALMPQYDGRNYGIVTPVKDQGNSNLCWAYSTVAASETSILRMKTDESATKDNLSLNPVAAAYRVYKRESDPLGNTNGE